MPTKATILSAIFSPIKTLCIEYWPIEKLKYYAKNPRKNDQAVERMCASIREFGFAVPILARSSGEVVDGHLRLKAAKKLGLVEVPVILCDGWSEAQVKAFRLMVNRSVAWADWDADLLGGELIELKGLGFDLGLTGFDVGEIGRLTLQPDPAEDEAPPVPATPVTKVGDLWRLGEHRVLCGDSTDAGCVGRLLGERKPFLMVTDPPYGVAFDPQWRDRAGLNNTDHLSSVLPRNKTGIADAPSEPGYGPDLRADWSEAFELVPSLQIAYVWHASVFTREVLNGLLRIGFLYPQQIIWDKVMPSLSRTRYWFQHEPCWFVRKKNAAWYGKSGEYSTIWRVEGPKSMMGGSKEEKFAHPTQKPVELMRRPILNHTREGETIYEPFGGSGTTLVAAETLSRQCLAIELAPGYCDVIVQRWEKLTGKQATLEATGQTLEQVRAGRRLEWADALHEEALEAK